MILGISMVRKERIKMTTNRTRPKWQQWLFGKTGGVLSPKVKSPWGYLLLGVVLGILIRLAITIIGRAI